MPRLRVRVLILVLLECAMFMQIANATNEGCETESASAAITIKASCEDVFELLSDHANYDELFTIVTDAGLLQEGDTEKNGVNAVRYNVMFHMFYAKEHIPAFNQPTSFEYVVQELYFTPFGVVSLGIPIPYTNDIARIELSETDDGCHVIWESILCSDWVPNKILIPIMSAMYVTFLEDTQKALKRKRDETLSHSLRDETDRDSYGTRPRSRTRHGTRPRYDLSDATENGFGGI